MKYLLLVLGIVFIVLYILFYRFSTPKSNEKIISSFSEKNYTAKIQYLEFDSRKVRILSSKEKIDPDLPTVLFIHGAIGSLTDFEKYMTDTELNEKANLISYDRIGYGPRQKGEVLNSIEQETLLVKKISEKLGITDIIPVGYSYGGPIALNYAIDNKLEQVVLCAPALYGSYEMIPAMIRFYKWRLTRFMVPNVWKSASKEKLYHAEDLLHYENKWSSVDSRIIDIHGNADWIVPYDNSIKLQNAIPNKEQFKLVTIEEEGHGLVWSSFDIIRAQLLELL
ncbi:alpha/beta fold hydrolase [Leptobacterium flavescens]|uniref:Alpha/beta fold hydrolase n=1 Tax=Leptobacterium flavescens TaxID=472055 RepID=A0A6P0UG88_9FLAO|nr:alpha/beta hydrolase [Leptobacterium flavescens]NER12291.1 alpha/beta fold hydrolase [Leptobacterium flavescens]